MEAIHVQSRTRICHDLHELSFPPKQNGGFNIPESGDATSFHTHTCHGVKEECVGVAHVGHQKPSILQKQQQAPQQSNMLRDQWRLHQRACIVMTFVSENLEGRVKAFAPIVPSQSTSVHLYIEWRGNSVIIPDFTLLLCIANWINMELSLIGGDCS